MKFTKMNGTGNDFIIINNIDEGIPEAEFPAIAKLLCTRGMSLGADGLMIVEKAEKHGDYKMVFCNADGSMGEMCGNGARCIARYGYERGLAGETQKIETVAGLVMGQRIDKRTYRIRLNNPSRIRLNVKMNIYKKDYECDYVELGNPGIPHAVVEYPDLIKADENLLRELGRKIRHFHGFPKGANVNFYECIGENLIVEKTYERGVEDFTLACGTGSGSVGVILKLKGKISGANIEIKVPGGNLYVDIESDSTGITGIYLTGLTNMVASGEITDEELFH